MLPRACLAAMLLAGCSLAAATPPPSLHHEAAANPTWPFAIHTWEWKQAAEAAFSVLAKPTSGTPALDAVVAGLTTCERDQCGGTVGFGGSPDENGETTLDALIIDGVSMEVGSVGALRGIANAVGVARAVMDYTEHTMLVGSQATDFALSMGFQKTNLSTPHSIALWQSWKDGNCQPNYRKNSLPDSTKSCGPYKPNKTSDADVSAESETATASSSSPLDRSRFGISASNHDTISMVTMDSSGRMAAGTSTNGAIHKIPGRVGDGPITGSGSYVDSSVGGCGSTGDGDVLMRFLPCFTAVQSLRAGLSPLEAAQDALARVARYFTFQGALVVVDRQGRHAGAALGFPFFYSLRTANMTEAQVVTITPGDAQDGWLQQYNKQHGDQYQHRPETQAARAQRKREKRQQRMDEIKQQQLQQILQEN